MSALWDEYYRRMAAWERSGDAERLAIVALYQEGFRCQESDPERSFALFTRGRDEFVRLDEPWWALFFERWRLTALTSYVMDFDRALPLAMELMVRSHSAEGEAHVVRSSILADVLCTYTQIDPLGHRIEIERGFAFLDGQTDAGPCTERFVLNYRWISYLGDVERWDEARALALGSMGLVDRSRDPGLRTWHGAWALYQLCRIDHALGLMEDVAGHAEHMAELSAKEGQLLRTRADAWLWRAVAGRAKGDEREASRSFHRGIALLSGIVRRDTTCADPAAAYHEASGDLKAALGVRDRELAAVQARGMRHRGCQVQVERCRLLALAGELCASDLAEGRRLVEAMRVPGWYLEKLRKIGDSAGLVA